MARTTRKKRTTPRPAESSREKLGIPVHWWTVASVTLPAIAVLLIFAFGFWQLISSIWTIEARLGGRIEQGDSRLSNEIKGVDTRLSAEIREANRTMTDLLMGQARGDPVGFLERLGFKPKKVSDFVNEAAGTGITFNSIKSGKMGEMYIFDPADKGPVRRLPGMVFEKGWLGEVTPEPPKQ